MYGYSQNTMNSPVDIGSKVFSFTYTNTLNTANYTNDYGRTTNDVYYKFTITNGMDIIISHCGSAVTDTYIYLLNSSGSLIASNDDYSGEGKCSSTTNSYLKMTNLAAGTYYVVSEGYSQNGDITTTIQGVPKSTIPFVNMGTYSTAFNYTDTKNTANYGNYYVGRSTNDVFYKFILSSAMDITISHCGSAVSDTYVHLLNSDGERIAYNDDYSGEGKCATTTHSYLFVSKLPAGTYYVVSEGYSQNGNITTTINGSVQRTVIDAGQKSSSFTYTNTINTLNCGNAYVGRPSNDVFYKFTLTKSMDVIISHCGSEISDTYVHLLNSAEERIAYNDDYPGDGKCSNIYNSYLKMTNLEAGTYYVVSEGYSQNGNITTTIQGIMPEPGIGTADKNYVHTRVFLYQSDNQYNDVIQYYDGLGRKSQLINKNFTSNAIVAERKDLISLIEYDNIGRVTKTWLPAGVSANNGAYKDPDQIKDASKTTNTNEGIADANPYYENVYEPTPLGRLSQEKNPGQEWQSGGKAIKTEYLSNTSSGDLYCKNYSPNELFVTKYTNEDNSTKYVFKDKQDQTVLVRIINDMAYNTYYKYDSWGNLVWVLPPEISEDNVQYPSLYYDNVKQFAYHYIYDAYNRCIAKKAPGSDYTYFIYDKTDQLIFSQDANQRNKSLPEWTFYIHDELGRIVLNGTCNNTLSYDNYPLNNVYVKAVRLNETNSYKGYSVSGITLASPQILTVNYYDDYGFMGYNGFSSVSDANFKPETIAGYGTPNGNGDKGFLTGTMSAKLDKPDEYLVSVMYYDYRGRLVQKKSNSILSGGIEKEYIAYNFIGQPVKKLNTHLATGKTPISEFYTYEYDNGSRLKRVQHQIQENITMLPGIILLENKYDDLGRLINSKRNNSAKLSVDLKYNVRSWITEITNLDNANKLFEVKLFYDKAYQSSTPRYGGDVTAMYWTLTGDKKRGYKFAYDNLSRLTSAQYLENDVNSDYYKIPLISYDKMGNITSIERWGKKADGTAASSYGIVDKLSMAYNGNRLTKITDTGANVTIAESSDFKDYSNNNGQYTYDFNGNVITDSHKGILGIRYNSLNLPEELAIKNLNVSGKTYYTYSASGAKLKTVHMNSTNLSYTPILGTTSGDSNFGQKKTTEYVANKIYENGVLKRIIVDGGYYDYAKRKYIFFLSDHLGNNRVVVNQDGTVLQKNHYYPFGMAFAENSKTEQAEQPYKYSGKELDQMHGLNLYDLTARSLDPAIGRFTTPDPLSEKYYSWSPYAYVMNNPLKNIDPTGMWIPGPNGTLRAEENDSFQTLIDYLSKIYGGAENIEEDEWIRLRDQVKDMKNASVSGDISGMSLTSETGTFENLVGKYLRSRSLEDPAWARTDYKTGAGNCSPTTFNRTQQAMAFVYGKDILGKMTWSNELYRRWQGEGGRGAINYGENIIPSMGYGTHLNKSLIMDGQLTTGAILQLTQSPGPEDRQTGRNIPVSWHAAIFINYTYDGDGNIKGMTYWDHSTKTPLRTIDFNYSNGGKYDSYGYKPESAANFK